LKSFGSNKDITDPGDKRSSKADEDRPLRDVSVIWGSMEIPKLFANSHSSQKLHKSFDTPLKQATSLARFE